MNGTTAVWDELKEMLREQLDYRELLYRMVVRDLTVRYKQAVMGVGWAVFMPLVNTVVFSVIFMRVARIETGDIPYPLFAFTGFLVWNFFASSLRFAVTSLSSNATLVGKVYFPREIFPFTTVVVAAVDLLVASVVLVGFMIYYGTPIALSLLAVPVVFSVQVVFTLSLALLVSMANLFYRDVKYLFEIVITVWMFSTSVVYPVNDVGGTLGRVLALNPMTVIVEAYRRALFAGEFPFDGRFLLVAAGSTLMLGFIWLRFHRAEFQFAENL